MATHSSSLAWKIPWTGEPGYSPRGHRESDTEHTHTHTHTHTLKDPKSLHVPSVQRKGGFCVSEKGRFLCFSSQIIRPSPGGSEVKASACNAGDPGSIPGSRRSPGEGNGNLLQYSCLENPMDGGAW